MVKQTSTSYWSSKLSQEAIEFTFPEIMAKIIGTIDAQGQPHLSLISSNKAIAPDTIK